jgi:methionine sulfoxide reductase heme-binding subunit
VSFYVKQWIGQRAWRTIHTLSFGTFLAAGLHGVFSGTDTSHPVVMGMYIGSLTIVLVLLVIRIAQAAAPEQPARAATPRGSGRRTAVSSQQDQTLEMPAQS